MLQLNEHVGSIARRIVEQGINTTTLIHVGKELQELCQNIDRWSLKIDELVSDSECEVLMSEVKLSC